MHMKDLIQNTISKIKKEHIKPEARWKFLLKKCGPWVIFILLVLAGALLLALIADGIGQLDWDLYRYAKRGAIVYLLSILPYFWIVFLSLLAIFTFIDLRNTQNGYKLSAIRILTFSLGAIFALGLLSFWLGFGKKFNDMMSSNVPMHGRGMMMTKQGQWMQPQEGFLAGTIISIEGDSVRLKDLNGGLWTILKDRNTLIRPLVKINEGENIKIIGRETSSHEFRAREIRPWMGPGMMNGQRPMMNRGQIMR